MKLEEIENRFIYHSPDEEKINKYNKIRDTAKHLALVINQSAILPDNETEGTQLFYWLNKMLSVIESNCPESDEKKWALNNLTTIKGELNDLSTETIDRDTLIFILHIGVVMPANAAIAINS
jgi:hypothetical protein